MDIKVFLAVFTTIFLAELGDKTQLATLLFAADKQVNKMCVFCAAALALLFSTALGVMLGGCAARFLDKRALAIVAGAGFIIVGIWTIAQGIRTAA